MIYTAGVLGLTEAAKSLKYGADRSANAFLEIVDRSEGATSGLLEKRSQSWIDGTIHSGVSKVVVANILYHAQKKKTHLHWSLMHTLLFVLFRKRMRISKPNICSSSTPCT